MKLKIRYRLWQVIVGLIALACLAALFYWLMTQFGTDKLPVKEAAKPKETRLAHITRAFLVVVYMIAFFYFSLNYFYQLLSTYRKIIDYVKTITVIILVSYAYHLASFYFAPWNLMKTYGSPLELFVALIRNTIPMLVASFLFAYVTVLRESFKQKKVLEAQKLELETQISQANFNFLKSQINPHFLHNTLNFLYARSLPYSPELSEGILTLSDIMRYALSQGNQKDGKAPLKDEIEHVHNVIRISQLRYNNQLKVNFDVSGQVDGALIIPFVLITIVENAFKHGDLKSPDYPIDIRLNVRGNHLYFYCSNKKKSGPKALGTGIGLENISKRLFLAYGDQYSFVVKDETETYTIELTIEQL